MNAQRMRQLVCRGILFLILLFGVFASSITQYSYAKQFRDVPNAKPSAIHLLGTDALGRDLLTRIAYGTRVSLLLAPTAALLATIIAAVLGGIAGLRGGRIETVVLAASDLAMALPLLFVLIALRALLPLEVSPLVSVVATFLVLGCLGWPTSLRVVWATARNFRNSDHVLFARALGYSNSQLVFHQVIPGLRPVLLAQFGILIPVFIVTEATLSMLGLGVMEPLPSWGNLLRGFEDISAISENPCRVAPLVLLVLAVTCFQFVVPRSGESS
jgi:peptide/nickel transport system permease protein